VVSTPPRPLYPRERPGTHSTGGWVGPRAGLDVCEKSRPHWDFFIYIFVRILCFIVLVLDFQWSFVSYRTACCGFFQQKKSDGFGRERTRDQIRSPDRPARSQSLYRLSYPTHSLCMRMCELAVTLAHVV
jgi:hypothetical protein